MIAHPTTYCFFCFEIEAVMVRWAMLGAHISAVPGIERAPAVKEIGARWRAQYGPIIDQWPRQPQPQPTEDEDAIWVERMISEIRKAG